jgi:hypothetical protein
MSARPARVRIERQFSSVLIVAHACEVISGIDVLCPTEEKSLESALAAAVEAGMPASEIVGVDPSEGSIAYAQKNVASARAHFEVGDA